MYELQPAGALKWAEHSGYFTGRTSSKLCINIAVLLRYMNHNRPVPCNELNTVANLLEGSVV